MTEPADAPPPTQHPPAAPASPRFGAARGWVLAPVLSLLALAALPPGRAAGSRAATHATDRSASRAALEAPRPTAAPAGRDVAAPACPFGSVEGVCLPAPRCAAGEFDLDGVCVSTSGREPSLFDEGTAELSVNSHVDRTGQLVVYEHVPRRPDLPASYDRYVYPTEPYGSSSVSSGYDLGEPDTRQRRAADLNYVGHGGVDLSQDRGAPVRVVALRGQLGDAEVVYAGWLFGTTVVLRHFVREGGATRTYLALHGHLDAIAPGVSRGAMLGAGARLGSVGDSAAPGQVHLHYEVRLVRPGVDPARIDPGRLNDQSVSVPCDPRNVLPLRGDG